MDEPEPRRLLTTVGRLLCAAMIVAGLVAVVVALTE
jgi:hypothetical protein